MEKRIVSFILISAMIISFGGNIVLASSSDTKSTAKDEVRVVELTEENDINPKAGIVILKWVGRVLVDAFKEVYSWYENTVKKNVMNWLTTHFKRDGYIYQTYAIGSPECIQVKVRGTVFNHKAKENWCGDNYANSFTIVKALQEYLKKMGYDPGVVDGYWGSNTKKAVTRFQNDRKLNVDGVVGKDTWEKLIRWK